jgi:hypothetical protein
VGDTHPVRPVKRICGITFTPELDPDVIIQSMESLLERVEDRSPVFNFSFTSYYKREMGEDLKKIFVSFQGLAGPDCLADLKLTTNRLEAEYKEDGHRRVNLDPGYLTGAKLVLASTKDFAHRIYVGRGIYGDVQLRFIHGEFKASRWTYPDYQTELALTFFSKVRDRFVKEEKQYG